MNSELISVIPIKVKRSKLWFKHQKHARNQYLFKV